MNIRPGPYKCYFFTNQSASVQLRGSIPVCIDVNKTGNGLMYVQQRNWNCNSVRGEAYRIRAFWDITFVRKTRQLLPISRIPYSWIGQLELPGLYVRDTWNIFATIFTFYHHRQTEQIFPADSENAVPFCVRLSQHRFLLNLWFLFCGFSKNWDDYISLYKTIRNYYLPAECQCIPIFLYWYIFYSIFPTRERRLFALKLLHQDFTVDSLN